MRPDIVVYNFPNQTQPQVLDIQITSPVPYRSGTLTISQARVPLRPANKAVANKQRKYNGLAAANNLGFIPIVFEITGRLHSQATDLLRAALQTASERRAISYDTLWNYWISSLMITLQRCLAKSIIVRAHRLVGQFQNNADTCPARISDFDHMDITWTHLLLSTKSVDDINI